MATFPSTPPMLAHHMVTTAFDLDGYRIVRNLGVVRGIVVRLRSIFGTLGASLQTLVGATSRCLASSVSRPAVTPST